MESATGGKLTPQGALRLAWFSWIVLLGVPVLTLLGAIYMSTHGGSGDVRAEVARAWFWGIMSAMVLIVPSSFFWRDYLFRPYRHGSVVEPRTYLAGMWAIWVPLAMLGMMASFACIAVRTLSPNIVPAGLALGVFLLTWPTGHAMTRPVGDALDAELYEEPR